ncbi:hypothetical protein KFL_001150020 [Klebsormidium nitens]|uniref:Uncharacterized protein n=1 Tax=Klebsormidium nitens TaxID=105231 RepID=A0A1Y1I043_KLENI|nr:hypothetical protein KFL_001150020 [Klebsormidium nitens]|eukprot:GAQ82541.1 hypothetical protein KFL_001150020 [Klebsormidium nitens]
MTSNDVHVARMASSTCPAEPKAARGTEEYHGLGSTQSLVRRGGDIIAIAHPLPKTGYKAPNAYGAKPIFQDATTTGSAQKAVQKVGDEKKKQLMPYAPNASRNRPAETRTNTVGRRTISTRNASQVRLADGDPDSRRPSKTTNQVYSEGILKTDVIGLSNQGISAEIARNMHAKQRR